MAADRGCLDAADAERFSNRLRGMEDARFQSQLATMLADDVEDAFDLPKQPTRFTRRDTEGDVVLDVTEGDAVEVTFRNTHSKKEDTVQGVIESIESRAPGEPPLFTLRSGVEFIPSEPYGAVRINGRRRGGYRSMRKLFRPTEDTIEPQEIDRTEELLEAIHRANRSLPPPESMDQWHEAQETINRVVGMIADDPPSPFEARDRLLEPLQALKLKWVNWMSDHVSSRTTVMDRRVELDRVIDALTTNKRDAAEAALEFLRRFGYGEDGPSGGQGSLHNFEDDDEDIRGD